MNQRTEESESIPPEGRMHGGGTRKTGGGKKKKECFSRLRGRGNFPGSGQTVGLK